MFCVLDGQDSGNICFGTELNGSRYFIKFAGAQPVRYSGDPADTVQRLQSASAVWAQLRLFAGAAYRPRLLVFSRAVHLVLLQLLVRGCAQLLPGSVTACSTLAARVLPVFRLPPDAAAAGFVFLCAALYKARQSLYN